MIGWLIALALILAFFAVFPALLRWMKSSGSKGRMGGIALGLGLAFAILFDPAKQEAMENIDDQKRRGGEKEGQGELLD